MNKILHNIININLLLFIVLILSKNATQGCLMNSLIANNIKFSTVHNIVIDHNNIYNNIAPEPGNPVLRRCKVLLSLIQTRLHPVHISTTKGA